MKLYTLKNFFATLALACLIPAVQAQFDDVYYDPDNRDQVNVEDTYTTTDQDGVTYYDDESYGYYDDEEYAYYDDYDYYYSSRIRRFHRSYSGFDFYDPCYVSYNYYDPFYNDAYYYPGSSIYISFGHDDYWSYRQWRRWNRWNHHHYNPWNNWCLTPSSYYYSYNSWYAPGYNYWGGYHGYHHYSNYYNNYYNSCPSPVSNYYGINHSTVNVINNGGTRGTYYGPRITGGGTGSSPRGPVIKPETIQPVLKGDRSDVTQGNDRPVEVGDGTKPRIITPSTPAEGTPGRVSTNNPETRDELTPSGGRDIPVDKEIKREEPRTSPGRPVFRPYPNDDKPTSGSDKPATDRPSYTPTPERPSTSPSRDNYTPRPETRPQYRPSTNDERPRYTPPSRNSEDERGTQERPSYTPRTEERPSYNPSRNDERHEAPPARTEERPSYSPPARSERSDDRPSYSPPSRSEDSGRSNDRPSYSPPQRSESSGGSSHSSPSRDNSSSRSSSPPSGGSPRSRG